MLLWHSIVHPRRITLGTKMRANRFPAELPALPDLRTPGWSCRAAVLPGTHGGLLRLCHRATHIRWGCLTCKEVISLIGWLYLIINDPFLSLQLIKHPVGWQNTHNIDQEPGRYLFPLCPGAHKSWFFASFSRYAGFTVACFLKAFRN